MEYLHQAFAFSRGMQGRQICHCEGRLRPWQSRAGTADPYWLPLKWHAPIASVAALRERHGQLQVSRHSRRPHTPPSLSLRGPNGAVAISGRQLRFRRWFPCYPTMSCEIAPQGHFLALRAQGATSAYGLLAMTIRGDIPFSRWPVPVVSAAPGAACRSPTMARAVGGVPPNLQVCKAVTDRRYTPFFGCFRF